MATRLFAIALMLMSFNWPALADSDVYKGVADSWIEFVDLPQADPRLNSQIKGGISYLLSDVQIRHRPEGYETFDRYAYKIVDRSGLEQGAAIRVEFDPATHKVTLNRLNIIRDGVVIDRLQDAKFDIFRREKDAERGIFDGWLTGYANIDDVRVGDIIDYGKTISRTPVVGRDLLFQYFGLAWDEPVALIRERVIWPSADPLEVRNLQTDVEPTIETQGALTTYLWQMVNPAPVKQEDNVPADYVGYPAVLISTTSDWQDIVDAVLPYYQLDQELPPEFAAKLDRIASQQPAPEDRMIAAMRLVQDDIRYVSLSMGSGSYIPRSPATVVASGFGDCKDKALLLASSLRRLGIEADVALTDINDGPALGRMLPALRIFDHAIVKAVIGSEIYWIDATNYLQGGKAHDIAMPDFGFALPLVKSGAGLEKIARRDLSEPSTFVDERFEFPITDGGPLVLTVTSTYKGLDADSMRYKLVNDSVSKIADSYLEYYNRQYPGITSGGPLKTSDDRDKNVVIVNEAYELPADALQRDDLAAKFPLKADVGVANLPTPTAVGRSGPIFLGSPFNKRHRVTVTNLKARFTGPALVDVLKPYLSFRINWSNTPTEFELDWNLKTLADQVPAADIADYLKAVDQMKDDSFWTYDFTYKDAVTDTYDDTSVPAVVALLAIMVALVAALVILMVRQTRAVLARSTTSVDVRRQPIPPLP